MQSTSHTLLYRAMFGSLVILVAGAADLRARLRRVLRLLRGGQQGGVHLQLER